MLAIGGSSIPKNGEPYAFVTNLNEGARERGFIAVAAWTKPGDAILASNCIGGGERHVAEEIVPGLSGLMRKIVCAVMLFEEFLSIGEAYGLYHSLRMIFPQKTRSKMLRAGYDQIA